MAEVRVSGRVAGDFLCVDNTINLLKLRKYENMNKKDLWLILILMFGLLRQPSAVSAASSKNLDNEIYRFLISQRNDGTGILASFINSDDEALQYQASTYDMALAGMGFLKLKDSVSARRILTFFYNRWNGNGFCNFYDIKSGNCGLETTVHLGPNMWIAMLALQYNEETGDRQFYPLARKIALWAMRLNHDHGGISMGPFQDWGADWPNVFSAENNIVAYAVFRALHQVENDKRTKALFQREMEEIRNFLDQRILVRDGNGSLKNIRTGCNPVEGGSAVSACDVVSMFLLVFDPQALRTFFSIDENAMINFAREKFAVKVDGLEGFDFTDETACLAVGRPRMISLEWTMQMACALVYVSDVYSYSSGLEHGQEKIARYTDEASFFAREVDKKAIDLEGLRFYPYATKGYVQVFPFAPWWKTPQGRYRAVRSHFLDDMETVL